MKKAEIVAMGKKPFPPLIVLFTLSLLFSVNTFAVPNSLTFQSKIYKPNGAALEASAVSFRFTTVDPTGTCILYVEDFANVDMQASAGLAIFNLGAGTKVFPVAAFNYPNLFNNLQPSFNCQGGGTYSPAVAHTDARKIILQFNDASGSVWQTLPAVDIASVPYANYAGDSEKLAGFLASDFLRTSTLPTCGAGTALSYDGFTISCAPTGGGSGTVTSASIVSTNGFSGSVANPTTTPAITISTSVTGLLKGNGTAISAAASGTDFSLGTSALGTGIIKSTTGTGALSIAIAGDFPILNQNTTGTAANVTGVVAAVNGGTGQSGFTVGDLLYANSATTLAKLPAAATTGYVLTNNGTATAPTWQAPTGSGTVNSGTINQMAYYSATGTAVSGNANVTVSSGALSLGVTGSALR